MRGRICWVLASTLTLSACGGGKDPLADLCVAEAASRLQGQVYRLDEKLLISGRSEEADGNIKFLGEVIMKPGTSGEELQKMSCTVAPATADAPARVIGFSFNVVGSGVTPR